MEVQNTILGMAVGYAMGSKAAAFDLETVNALRRGLPALFATRRRTPTPLAALLPLLGDRAAAMTPPAE